MRKHDERKAKRVELTIELLKLPCGCRRMRRKAVWQSLVKKLERIAEQHVDELLMKALSDKPIGIIEALLGVMLIKPKHFKVVVD